jgi:Zn-dependent protease with chaperone function
MKLSLLFPLLLSSLWAGEGFDRNEFLLGLWVANQVQKTHKVLPNHKDHPRVVEIATRIVEHAGRKDLYSVAIIKAPVANAFALPGGFFFITDTLLKLNLSDDELAFLIGHEIAHVQNRHFERIQKEQAKTSFATALATIGSTLLASKMNSGNDHERLRRQGALSRKEGPPPIKQPNSVTLPPHLAPVLMSNLFGTLYLLHSQRDFEYEADLSGAKLAVAAGYDLEKGTGMLRKLFYSNYRNSEHVEWTTHPLTQSRIQALKARGKEFTKGKPMTSTVLVKRQRDWANRLLNVYEEMPLWSKAKGLSSINVQAVRGLLLMRASHLSSDTELKKRSLRLEILHGLFPKIQASSFLVADHGVLHSKVDELLKLGGHLNPDFVSSSANRQKLSLKMNMDQLELTSPGYLQLEYLLRNFPNHPDAESWRWQHWTKEPKIEKIIEDVAPLLESDKAGRVRKHLLKAMTRIEKDPWAYVKMHEILDLDIDPEVLSSNLKSCESLERLLRFQHEFPNHPWIDRVNQRRTDRLKHHYRAGRLAMASRQPQKAVEHFREILLFDTSGSLETEARELIYRLNTIGTP